MSQHVIALVGNPNCGKTTVFNGLTGANQQVGNWPGVTVEKRSGSYRHGGSDIEVVDLPGTYCLDVVDHQVSMDERIARDFILAREAELIVNILDASNIERNLYLTTQLLEMGLPVVIVLNMMDVAKEKGVSIDVDELSRQLGCPVFCAVASKKKGIADLKQELNQFLSQGLSPARSLSLGETLESSLAILEPDVREQLADSRLIRWASLKLLEGEVDRLDSLSSDLQDKARKQREVLEQAFEVELDILIADGRYGRIADLMKAAVSTKGESANRLTQWIDRVVLNRVLGLPIFFGIMYVMFLFSITLGSAFIDFFDILSGTLFVDGTSHLLANLSAPDWLIAVLANGVGGGMQTVSTFIPVIAFLFLFLSILEDSGYMARAAFVMDRLMCLIGLPGKAFVPMLVGFGCNVPAIMATRTLESHKDRLLTMAMAPFMSCGARLPVYALFAAAFFPESGQNVVFTLYLVGILAAVFTGVVLKRSLLTGEPTPFIMELPEYHLPSVRQVLLRTWDRLKAFVLRAGKAIVVVVVLLNTLNSLGTDGSFGNENTRTSLLSQIGQSITPAFHPMGMSEDNWPAAVGVFTGILAKEAVVGTLNAMYTSMADKPEAEENDFDLGAGFNKALQTVSDNLKGLGAALTDPLGLNVGDLTDIEAVAQDQEVELSTFAVMRELFNSEAAVVAYLLFILLYTPCVAALGAIYREAGTRWALFVAGWTFFLGYAVAVLYYQLSRFSLQPLTSLGWVLTVLAGLLLLLMLMKRAAITDEPVAAVGQGR